MGTKKTEADKAEAAETMPVKQSATAPQKTETDKTEAMSTTPLKQSAAAPQEKTKAAKIPDPTQLAKLSNEELVKLMLQVALEVNKRFGTETVQLAVPDKPETFVETDVTEYVRLPTIPPTLSKDTKPTTWRIQLLSADPKHEALGLEIYDDIIIGRALEGIASGLDLSKHGAERKGVSRQHARLRPTETSLTLTDLGSLNGTYVNGARLKKFAIQALSDGDTISFGQLHYKLKVISKPKVKSE
jgi:hypothetical protein